MSTSNRSGARRLQRLPSLNYYNVPLEYKGCLIITAASLRISQQHHLVDAKVTKNEVHSFPF